MKKIAFTLAETLITLGVIGIVAAITIPMMITTYQKNATALAVKKAYTELNQVLKMATADYGEPSGWQYYGADELQPWVETYIAPYLSGAQYKSCKSNEKCFGLKLPFPLHFPKPGSVNTMVGQYVVAKIGTPVAYGFFRYPAPYDKVTRIKAYIHNPHKKYAMLGRDVFTFILTTADENPTFKPYGYGTLGSYGISTKDRQTLLGTGWGGCNPKASGSGYWGPGDACAAVIMLDGWKISRDYPW